MKLVIVESPTKQRTIKKYLGAGYEVMASVGHIRDLAMSGKYNLGVDIYDPNFTPTYEILKGKESLVERLKEAANKAEMVYLASDPDREGEAISWHLSEVLGLDKSKYKRLEFHEITRYAIQDAVEHPRDLIETKIEAQETRRIIDRILGFRISYVLSRDTGAPSAGRVQSATLRLVYDRTLEQENFVPETTYYLSLDVKDEDGTIITADLVNEKDEKIPFKTEDEALEYAKKLGDILTLKEIYKEEKTIGAKPPFALSELYQDANAKYHMSTKQILAAAKNLFENGYITYPRTDSHRLAPEFINKTKELIKEQYGEEYVGSARGQVNANSQDAHEALRPSDLSVQAKDIAGKYNQLIYDLIYKRVVQSIMKSKVEDQYTYVFDCGGSKFVAKNNFTTFKGFTIMDKQPKNSKPNHVYSFKENESYDFTSKSDSVTTKKPLSFTEGTLVKKMEETGIGRPSTYATMVSMLIDRRYIEVNDSFINITRFGRLVIEYLIRHFANTVVNIEYTSDMERKLDAIEEGTENKLDILTQANILFLEEFNNIITFQDKVYIRTGGKCPKCGGDLIYRLSRSGEFIGCINYPSCNYVQLEEVGRNCPECGSPLVYKNSATGRFIGCSKYPECKHMEPIEKPKYRRRKK